MESCIYRIVNILNNHCYIGSCKNSRIRWNNHKSALYRNIHHSLHLQNAWNKYGKGNFIFQVLEYCDYSTILERENYYIQENKPEYNILQTAHRGRYRKHTEESKKLMSSRKKKKRVFQFGLDGSFLKEWESISQVVRELNLKSTAHIIACCKGKRATCSKFRWSYSKEVELLPTKYKYEKKIS
jgi:hypothetical protein